MIHNKHVCPEYAGDCKDQFPVFSPVGINKKDLAGMIPVFSTIGRGPRGEGVTVKQLEDGSYQFISTTTGEVVSEVDISSFEVINNTPNPVSGEPIFVTIRQTTGGEVKDCNLTIPSGKSGKSIHTCSALLDKNESDRYSLLISNFAATPSVSDSVLFKTLDGEDEFLAFGEVYSVTAGTVGVNALSYLGVGWDSPNIGDNGNWWVGNSDTGVPATGPKGDGLPEAGKLGQVMTKTESGPMWADVPEPEWPIPVDKGGTGANTAVGALANLGAAAAYHEHAARDITNGTLEVVHGGTGKATHTANAVLTGNGTSAVNNVATAAGALYATEANGAAKFGTLPITQGGTGATSAAAARTALGVTMTNLGASDYSTASGTSGIWTYFKFNSGVALCCGSYTETVDITHSQNDNHYGYVTQQSYPFTFKSKPNVICNAADAGGNVWTVRGADGTTAKTPRIFPISSGSAPGSVVTSTYFAVGRWK